MAKYHIYTDGSARFNPGPGGWGMVVMNSEDTEILFKESDSEDHTTNNRMELKAMICALGWAEDHPSDDIIIFSDSAYVVNSCNSWMMNWAANGWKNSKKVTVENVDLMKALYEHIRRPFPNFSIHQCKGHNGEVGNELADALATGDMRKYQSVLDGWDIYDREFEHQQQLNDEYEFLNRTSWCPND